MDHIPFSFFFSISALSTKNNDAISKKNYVKVLEMTVTFA